MSRVQLQTTWMAPDFQRANSSSRCLLLLRPETTAVENPQARKAALRYSACCTLAAKTSVGRCSMSEAACSTSRAVMASGSSCFARVVSA